MSDETGVQGFPIHSLIPLADFKTILSVDDREDSLSRLCLVTATYSIEQYCMRRLILKKHFERIETRGDLLRPLGVPLREYPVREMLAVFSLSYLGESGEIVEPEFYAVIPELEEGMLEDTVYSLSLSPALFHGRRVSAVKAVYSSGYASGGAPPDLASACLELAAWNMARYRGKRIGVTGNSRGGGFGSRSDNGVEYLEISMPENVRLLVEPYKRRII